MANARSRKTDAIQLLEKDHAEVQDLFAEFKRYHEEETEGGDELKQEIIDEVCAALKVHAQIEEEIFYPAGREALPDEEDMFNDALADHGTAKELIEQIEAGEASNTDTCDRFLTLSDDIDEHVQEEETEMFPKLLDSSMDMEEVGGRLAARKQELEKEASGLSAQKEKARNPSRGPSTRAPR